MDNVEDLHLSRELYTNTSSYFTGILSPKSKHLLTLPKDQRTGGVFRNLLVEIENIEFFKMFSSHTKETLAETLMFVTRRADEFLLVQGKMEDPPQALYVIMSGVVTEHYKPTVGTTDETSSNAWPEKILRKGEFFGHVDILYDRPPTVNAQTVGYCELLMLMKEDFVIVKTEIEARCTRASHYLRTSESIKKFRWSDDEYQVLEIYSKLCAYGKDENVYSGAEDTRPFWSHFVVSGECKIARELTYSVTESGHMIAVSQESRKEAERSGKLQTARFVFEEVKHGYYFGVGENFDRNHVIASSFLECLLIPRLLLVFKDKDLLRAMSKDLTDSLPSDREVLENHSKLVAASKKKVEMFKELFEHKAHISKHN